MSRLTRLLDTLTSAQRYRYETALRLAEGGDDRQQRETLSEPAKIKLVEQIKYADMRRG